MNIEWNEQTLKLSFAFYYTRKMHYAGKMSEANCMQHFPLKIIQNTNTHTHTKRQFWGCYELVDPKNSNFMFVSNFWSLAQHFFVALIKFTSWNQIISVASVISLNWRKGVVASAINNNYAFFVRIWSYFILFRV